MDPSSIEESSQDNSSDGKIKAELLGEDNDDWI